MDRCNQMCWSIYILHPSQPPCLLFFFFQDNFSKIVVWLLSVKKSKAKMYIFQHKTSWQTQTTISNSSQNISIRTSCQDISNFSNSMALDAKVLNILITKALFCDPIPMRNVSPTVQFGSNGYKLQYQFHFKPQFVIKRCW